MDQTREVPTHLVDTARSDPDAIDGKDVETLLADDREEMRNTGLKVLVGLAIDDPDRVVPFADDVVDCLDESYGLARSHAALVCWLLAEERPDLVELAIPKLVANLRDIAPLYRFRAARAVAALGRQRPASFVDHADGLVAAIVEGPNLPEPGEPTPPDAEETIDLPEPDLARSAATKEVAANVLVAVAGEAPAVVADRFPDLVPELEHDDQVEHVRGGIVDAIGRVARADPAAAESAIDPLIDLLEDDSRLVRSRAIRALGYAEAAGAVEPLREVAESDPDPDVRDLASETADWLEENVLAS
ncbi:HEAT repeat domain-containing protein [Saliphagus infecundisoli]|uniref:HEAT repeat domain-containing protein n=1 Tax=Saliphagus infecundisoli TaxID=1849069 RepID=A0ABD5QCY3_9EURY|nr:HEAT repeat domain-containing protein [Saliphagus infecundisoli]